MTITRRRLWALGLLAVLVAACGEEVQPPVTHGDFGQRTPASLSGLVPAIDVAIDDQAPLPFLVDTGSPVTLLNATSYGHNADYSAQEQVDLGAFGLTFESVTAVTYAAFPDTPCGEPEYGGIVGGDLLQFYSVTVDYLGAALFLWDQGDTGVAIGHAVAAPALIPVYLTGGGLSRVVGITLELPATRLVVDGTLEGRPSVFLVDTGASMVTIPSTVYEALPPAGRPEILGIPVQTVYGEEEGLITRLASLTIGDVTVASVPTFVVPDSTLFDSLSTEVGAEVQALVGGTFLRHFQVTVHYRAAELELARYQEPVHVNPLEFVGPGFDLGEGCDGGFFVARVHEGTSAAEQGVRVGDQLVAIETQDLEGLTYQEVDRLLHAYEPGSVVDLRLSSGFRVTTVSLTYGDLLPPYAEQG